MIQLESPRNTTGWNLGGTNTFRKSSKKLLERWGMNLQNPSKPICKLHLADKGKKLIQADQAGAEALIVAYLVPNGNFRQLFLNGIKPHTFVAMHLFSTTWEEELKEPIQPYLDCEIAKLKEFPRWKEISKDLIPDYNEGKYYFIGKKSCHSFNYRKGPETFIFDVLKESEGKVVLDKAEGKRIHGIYHSLFPEISCQWWPETDNLLRQTRILYNLFGFPRYFGGAFSDKFFREAISFVPQSTVGCITSRAFCNLQNFIEETGVDWDLLNDKHDSILMQVPDNEKEIQEGITRLKDALEQDLVSPRGEKFKMRSGISTGYNWGPWSEKNPDGMKEIK